ncbi:hypothetical protein QM360_04190 [Streptococcus cristatus]|uniref:hypothetical protein n=1 Tax=Streptococcus cristatus TaxID=45634 RepID=UPI002051B380|nr:MAG TPA: hypothetical protein [Caudoviricetes sp.]
MNENIQSKLAIEIASKSIRIATLEAQNEELQAQLQQVLEHNTELKERLSVYEPRAEEAPETEKGE